MMTVFLSLLQGNFNVGKFENVFVVLELLCASGRVHISLESRTMPKSIYVFIRKCTEDKHSREISGSPMLFWSLSFLKEQEKSVRSEFPESAFIKGEAYLTCHSGNQEFDCK